MNNMHNTQTRALSIMLTTVWRKCHIANKMRYLVVSV